MFIRVYLWFILLVSPFTAFAGPVVVVRSAAQGLDSEAKAVEWALQAFLVPFDAVEVSPSNPLKALPADCRVAMVTQPLAARMTPAEALLIEQHVARGGKIIAFGEVSAQIAELLGFRLFSSERQTSAREFYSLRCDGDLVRGIPPEVVQASKEAYRIAPLTTAKVAGHWAAGNRTGKGAPAIVLSDNGAYLASDLTREQIRRKGQLLHALIAHFMPELCESNAKTWLDRTTRIGRFSTLDAFRAALETAQGKERFDAQLAPEWDKALKLKVEAEAAFTGKDYPLTVARSLAAVEALERLYPQAFSQPPDEFRGVWVSDYCPVGDWDQFCSRLKQAGFTAVFPFIGAAGLAHYRSDILPESDEVSTASDRLSRCVEAAHRHGIEVHAWHSTFVVGDEKQTIYRRMVNEGRVVRDAKGNPVKFLCPTNPANWDYEIAVCREILQRYAVEGLHLDYMRFPTYPPTYCYCDSCRERFQADTGAKITQWPEEVLSGDMAQKYLAWGTQQITTGLRRWSEAMRKEDPHPNLPPSRQGKVQLSAAVFGWVDARARVGQDSKAWIEQSVFDFLIYMNFHPSNSYYASLVQSQAVEAGGNIPVYSGIGAFSHACWFASPVELMEQIQLTREQKCLGFVLYQNTPTFQEETLPPFGR